MKFDVPCLGWKKEKEDGGGDGVVVGMEEGMEGNDGE